MSAPLVSVICTAFNHADYIRETLDGFLAQRCDFPIEVIVHDDASKDGTAEIIREYTALHPHLFVPILQPENVYSRGGRPWFICFERARGKYIAICEGDDVWTDPLKLQRQVNDLEAHPDRMLSFHDVSVIDDSGGVFAKYKRYSDMAWNGLDPGRDRYDLHDLIRASLCPTCSVVFRKPEPFVVPEWIRSLPFADQPLFIWVARGGSIQCEPGELAAYRRHEASSSRTAAGTDRFTVGGIRMHLALLRELPVDYHDTIRSALRLKVRALLSLRALDPELRSEVQRAMPGLLPMEALVRTWARWKGYLRTLRGAWR